MRRRGLIRIRHNNIEHIGVPVLFRYPMISVLRPQGLETDARCPISWHLPRGNDRNKLGPKMWPEAAIPA